LILDANLPHQPTLKIKVLIALLSNTTLKANVQSVSARCTFHLPHHSHACVGVLTKPDRIPTGEESSWLPFIRNEKESLEHNWYCVKQPSSFDLRQNPSWADARRREDEFFSMTAPWSELDSFYQKYLRTSNLVERLSSVLSDLIAKRYAPFLYDASRIILLYL
jgi:Dynamin central region